MREQVALFGGSFDPPHLGHVLAMALVLSAEGVDRVWMMPCYDHAFSKDLSSFEDRVALCRLAAAPFGERVDITDVERHLGGKSWTIESLRRLRSLHPHIEFSLILGMDVLHEREHWRSFDEIEATTRLHVLARQGVEALPEYPALPLLPRVSSTEVRQRVREGLEVRDLVPAAVASFIAEKGLYLP